jgi:protein-tyrosine phosphatase/rhodanese-related sulfurtransferase
MVKHVDPAWLASANPNQILLLDARTADEYAGGCIRESVHICCVGVVLRRLRNGSLKVESLLNTAEDKAKYVAAKDSEAVCVVVYDQNSPNAETLSEKSIASLMLRKVSRDCKHVVFLQGGYDGFLARFPALCDVPDSAEDSLLKRRPSSLLLQISTMSLSVKDDASESEDSNPSSPEDEPSPSQRDATPYQILPHLYLGCRKVAACLPGLKASGITNVLNVTSSIPNNFLAAGLNYKQIAVEDSHDVNMIQHLPEAFGFIERARLSGERVLVHCHAGMSRSVTVILAYLMKFFNHTLDSAYEHVKRIKSDISPNFSFMGQLLEYECTLRPSPSDSGIGSISASPVENHYTFVLGTGPTSLPSPVNFTSRPCVLAS